jgi:hypothetical protein
MDRETADAFDRAFAVPGARRATLGWCRANIFGGRYRTILVITQGSRLKMYGNLSQLR